MNMPVSKYSFIVVLLIGALSACSTSPTPRLYILEPMATSASPAVDQELSITVGPVTLPEHLDRRGIVTHDQRYRVNSAEFDRWAEPLDQNITRVLSENLTVLIPSNQVVAYPPYTSQIVDFKVPVRIISFGTSPDGRVVLSATWRLHDATNAPGKPTRTMYSSPRRSDDVVALVEAMSQVIEQLSRDIANAIIAASAEPAG
jgi:uncharacterized lipoprotein YmbA